MPTEENINPENTTNKERTLTLTETDVNKLIRYLSSKPFGEVYQLVGMLEGKWNEQNGK